MKTQQITFTMNDELYARILKKYGYVVKGMTEFEYSYIFGGDLLKTREAMTDKPVALDCPLCGHGCVTQEEYDRFVGLRLRHDGPLVTRYEKGLREIRDEFAVEMLDLRDIARRALEASDD